MVLADDKTGNFLQNQKRFCDDHVSLSRTISMSQLFQAETLYIDRVKAGERNVRVLVCRDVNVMQWLQTDASNPLNNVYLEVEFLNANKITETTIGDVFISKIQRTAHQSVLIQIRKTFEEWGPEPQWSLHCNTHLIAPGGILRPDLVVFHTFPGQMSSPYFIIDVEIQNRTPLDVHDRFLRYFASFPSLRATIEINFGNSETYADCSSQNTRNYSALAIVYQRNEGGQVFVADSVDFGIIPLDPETISDLSSILPQHQLRHLAPRPDPVTAFPDKCPWTSPRSSNVNIVMDAVGPGTKSRTKFVAPIKVDLWRLLRALVV